MASTLTEIIDTFRKTIDPVRKPEVAQQMRGIADPVALAEVDEAVGATNTNEVLTLVAHVLAVGATGGLSVNMVAKYVVASYVLGVLAGRKDAGQ